MYKVFLTFRYLTRKAIVVFPILGVWLCVAMLIVVTSIMGGFVERVQDANRRLLGDVVVEATERAGWAYYEEFQKELGTLKDAEGKPLVEASTPVARAYGLINLPDYQYNTFAQVVGIDAVGRAKVSGFRESLFRQYSAPLEAVEDLSGRLPADAETLQHWAADHTRQARERWVELEYSEATARLSRQQWLLRGGSAAAGGLVLAVFILLWRRHRAWRGLTVLWAVALVVGLPALGWDTFTRLDLEKQRDRLEDARDQANEDRLRAGRTWEYALRLPAGRTFKTADELKALLVPAEPSFTPPPLPSGFGPVHAETQAAPEGCIIGVDVIPGFYKRDRRGNYIRRPEREFTKAVLTVVPVSVKGGLVSTAQSLPFTVVDDSYTRVFDVDSTYVYAPLASVQKMALMSGGTDPDTGEVYPARCSELSIKVRDGDDPVALRAARRQISDLMERFVTTHPKMVGRMGTIPMVQTWDEKQARYIGAVRNEKRMITFILLLMSEVVLDVIFLIFYMIVRDKTRDIGIIKALGGSEEGVAGIFVTYGLVIGLVGGLLGMITGVEFVWHTNQIHEWIYQVTGVMIWNRSVYLFDRIPDTVNCGEVLFYVGIAVLAGVVGALIPAIVAGRQDPVRAVRYE